MNGGNDVYAALAGEVLDLLDGKRRAMDTGGGFYALEVQPDPSDGEQAAYLETARAWHDAHRYALALRAWEHVPPARIPTGYLYEAALMDSLLRLKGAAPEGVEKADGFAPALRLARECVARRQKGDPEMRGRSYLLESLLIAMLVRGGNHAEAIKVFNRMPSAELSRAVLPDVAQALMEDPQLSPKDSNLFSKACSPEQESKMALAYALEKRMRELRMPVYNPLNVTLAYFLFYHCGNVSRAREIMNYPDAPKGVLDFLGLRRVLTERLERIRMRVLAVAVLLASSVGLYGVLLRRVQDVSPWVGADLNFLPVVGVLFGLGLAAWQFGQYANELPESRLWHRFLSGWIIAVPVLAHLPLWLTPLAMLASFVLALRYYGGYRGRMVELELMAEQEQKNQQGGAQ